MQKTMIQVLITLLLVASSQWARGLRRRSASPGLAWLPTI
jgi:hypothetical protein